MTPSELEKRAEDFAVDFGFSNSHLHPLEMIKQAFITLHTSRNEEVEALRAEVELLKSFNKGSSDRLQDYEKKLTALEKENERLKGQVRDLSGVDASELVTKTDANKLVQAELADMREMFTRQRDELVEAIDFALEHATKTTLTEQEWDSIVGRFTALKQAGG